MAATRVASNFFIADSESDMIGFPDGYFAGLRDPDPEIVAKIYKKIAGVWEFQYNQADQPSMEDRLEAKQNKLPTPLAGKYLRQKPDGTGLEWVTVSGGTGGYDGDPATIVQDATHRFHTDAQAADWDSKEDGGAAADALNDANLYTDQEITALDIAIQALLSTKETAGAAAAAETAANNYTDGEITGLKDGVASGGDTLQKLYNLILGGFQEVTVADIAARDAYDVAVLPCHVFVTDDGDARWALYKATTTGVGATFVKISDPDLLNAVLSASQIKTAYESNPDTNAFTTALLNKLNAIAAGATLNSTDAQLRDRSTHSGTQLAATISDFTAAALAAVIPDQTGNSGKVLQTNGTVVSWETPSGGLSQQQIFGRQFFGI